MFSLAIISVILIVFLAACGSNSDNNKGGENGANNTSNENNDLTFGESYEWTMGFNTVEDSIRGVAAKTFKEIIEEETDGRITIELFPNEELGTDNEMVESIQVGALDYQQYSSGGLAEISPEV